MNWRGAIRRLIPYLIAIVGGFLLAYMVAAFVFFPSGAAPGTKYRVFVPLIVR